MRGFQVEVLDAKRAMQVNVYVRSLGIPIDQLVEMLTVFDAGQLSDEQLRG